MTIDIKQLTHTYDVSVLRDLNLHLKGYKSVAIIGVSGSGKSTLVRILAGLEKATSGSAFINNNNVLSIEHKNNIGFVFQSHNLFPHLTLKRNITLVLEQTRNMTKQKANEVAMNYLDLLHLEDQANKLPKHVSGGQAQRASIARALSVNPNIMFLDEPTASLDPILTYDVLEAIRELRGTGMEFVFVSHVLSFVQDFADYVIFMDKGKIIEQGTPDILQNPKSDLLKDFMNKVK